MKRYMRHSIYAMSRVGYTSDNIEIRIYTDDPGKVPHFHFRSDKLDGCIRIDRSEYFPHGHHTSRLNSQQVRSLVSFLRSNSKKRPAMTNWQVVLMLWDINNSDIELGEDYPMPDYLHDL